MGTDFGIGCRDCAPAMDRQGRRPSEDSSGWFTYEWDNCHDVEALQLICEASKEILALDEKLGDLFRVHWGNYDSAYCYDLVKFMKAHRGHKLAPMSEYLNFDGETGRCESLSVMCVYGSARCPVCNLILCDKHHAESGCLG